MKRKRFSGEQIAAIVKEAERGMPVAEMDQFAQINRRLSCGWVQKIGASQESQ